MSGSPTRTVLELKSTGSSPNLSMNGMSNGLDSFPPSTVEAASVMCDVNARP